MKILIAGLGSIGFRHANNFKQLGVDKLVGFDPVTKPLLDENPKLIEMISSFTDSGYSSMYRWGEDG